jgi:type III secretion system YscJ/HrcJ family lipoprotein
LLEHEGVAADKLGDAAPGAYKIIVAHADLARAVALLEANDLPRRGRRGVAETFATESLMPSPVEERARYAAALASELERTLEALPGAVGARVHLALPAPTLEALAGVAARERPTASVLLAVRGASPLAEAELRRLVAGAVPGLQAADVSLVVADRAAPPASGEPLVRLGPLLVARAARPTLAACAAIALAAILGLALALVVAARRLAAASRRTGA